MSGPPRAKIFHPPKGFFSQRPKRKTGPGAESLTQEAQSQSFGSLPSTPSTASAAELFDPRFGSSGRMMSPQSEPLTPLMTGFSRTDFRVQSKRGDLSTLEREVRISAPFPPFRKGSNPLMQGEFGSPPPPPRVFTKRRRTMEGTVSVPELLPEFPFGGNLPLLDLVEKPDSLSLHLSQETEEAVPHLFGSGEAGDTSLTLNLPETEVSQRIEGISETESAVEERAEEIRRFGKIHLKAKPRLESLPDTDAPTEETPPPQFMMKFPGEPRPRAPPVKHRPRRRESSEERVDFMGFQILAPIPVDETETPFVPSTAGLRKPVGERPIETAVGFIPEEGPEEEEQGTPFVFESETGPRPPPKRAVIFRPPGAAVPETQPLPEETEIVRSPEETEDRALSQASPKTRQPARAVPFRGPMVSQTELLPEFVDAGLVPAVDVIDLTSETEPPPPPPVAAPPRPAPPPALVAPPPRPAAPAAPGAQLSSMLPPTAAQLFPGRVNPPPIIGVPTPGQLKQMSGIGARMPPLPGQKAKLSLSARQRENATKRREREEAARAQKATELKQQKQQRKKLVLLKK